MIRSPASNKGSENEGDRLQSLLRPIFRLDLLLLFPPEPDHHDGDVADADADDDDEPDPLPDLVDQVRSLCPSGGLHQLGILKRVFHTEGRSPLITKDHIKTFQNILFL